MHLRRLSWFTAVLLALTLPESGPFAILGTLAKADTPGPAGYALQFDGSDDEVIIPRSASLEPTQALTVECWAKSTGSSESEARLVRKEAPFAAGYLLSWQQNNGRVELRLHTGSQNLFLTDTVANTTYLNQWHHFAGVYSATENIGRLYVDGTLVAQAAGFGPLVHTPDPLYIGGTSTSTYETFRGLIDEVRIWSVARTRPQIQAGMNSTLAGCEAGLIDYWKLDDMVGLASV